MARSGQITVATAGTAVAGPNEAGRVFGLVAHPDNTDTVCDSLLSAGDVEALVEDAD